MPGTDRVRHCGICDKEVWNLTAMDAEEAEAFLDERRTNLPCLVLHRRLDGYFQDGRCEPGEQRMVRAAALATTLGLVAALGVLAASRVEPSPPSCARGPAPSAAVEYETHWRGRGVVEPRSVLAGAPEIGPHVDLVEEEIVELGER
jgi:hypothetical protein